MQTATQVGKPLTERAGMPRKIVAANWKFNSPDLTQWTSFPAFPEAEVVICPSLSLLKPVSETIPNIILGAQDAGDFGDLGVKYVIIGHSDRRKQGESDEVIAQKVQKSLTAGQKAILCVGEAKEIRNLGIEDTQNFIEKQVIQDLKSTPSDLFSNLLIAYEPIWAISTSPGAEADAPENAALIIRFIKSLRPEFGSAHFIYGGSVNRENSGKFLNHPDIQGALVGKASLDPIEFQDIIKSIHGQ
jgi:triosephosphate isomerase